MSRVLDALHARRGALLRAKYLGGADPDAFAREPELAAVERELALHENRCATCGTPLSYDELIVAAPPHPTAVTVCSLACDPRRDARAAALYRLRQRHRRVDGPRAAR